LEKKSKEFPAMLWTRPAHDEQFKPGENLHCDCAAPKNHVKQPPILVF
jgi:hypothetical protein